MTQEWQIAIAGIVVSIAIPVFGALVAWMFKVSGDLGSIAEALKGIPVLWVKVDKHAEKLDEHGQRIVSLEKATGVCDGQS